MASDTLALGSQTFTEEYVSGKVQEWTKEIKHLAQVAVSQPHAAYAAFTSLVLTAYVTHYEKRDHWG